MGLLFWVQPPPLSLSSLCAARLALCICLFVCLLVCLLVCFVAQVAAEEHRISKEREELVLQVEEYKTTIRELRRLPGPPPTTAVGRRGSGGSGGGGSGAVGAESEAADMLQQSSDMCVARQ